MKKDREDFQRKLQEQQSKAKKEKKVIKKKTSSQSDKMLEEKSNIIKQKSFEENESIDSLEDYLGKRKMSSLALENTENEDSNATKVQELSNNDNKKLKVDSPTRQNEDSLEHKDSSQSNIDEISKIKKIKEMVKILNFL